jgi:hypothetical protein
MADSRRISSTTEPLARGWLVDNFNATTSNSAGGVLFRATSGDVGARRPLRVGR